MEREFLKKDVLIKVVATLFVIALYCIVFLGKETALRLTQEDNLTENLGAIFLLMASVFYFASFIQSSGLDQDKNKTPFKEKYFYLFFGIIFFLGAGEEISWGQRLIGWETPPLMLEINHHKETNLHNIQALRRGIFRLDYWFFAFWFSYCLILPIAIKYSLEIRKRISHFRLPVPPLWIGLLLLTNIIIYVIPMSFPSHWPYTRYVNHAFLEIMESNLAFIFAVLAFHELRKQLLLKKENR
jgi:hypothetical protein